ncbi:hypothetical protein MNBD_PLANCTO03-485 [hydrothermal vent metagenome]|uniref:Uncharacterized protein n=1 Tax=hydrothermal vent metagenome TaxID=652676 RepID=A0A3B1DQE6_9ZZZZ
MDHRFLHTSAAFCVTLGLWALPCVGQDYTVTDLGAFPGGETAWAFGINDAGQIAASAMYNEASQFHHAALWDDGVLTDLGQLGEEDFTFRSFATAINAQGHVVGGSPVPGGFGAPLDRAFLHDGTEMILLPPLSGGRRSFAFDINDNGYVVGNSGTNEIHNNKWIIHAVLWTNRSPQDLGTLGGRYSWAYAINNSHTVVGASLLDNGPVHAFFWSDGTMTDMGTLGGASSRAWDINETGQIVGWAQDTDAARRAFLFEQDTMTDLGTLPGAKMSEAYGVNNAGQIVGMSWVPGQGPHAVLWDGGIALDLNDLVENNSPWTLQVARQINNSGQIVGYGRLEGVTRAFLLTLATCAADIDGDGDTDMDDFLTYLSMWTAGDPLADWNADGTINTQDFIAYLGDWAAGCP